MTVIIQRMSDEMRERRERMGMLSKADNSRLVSAQKALEKAKADMVKAKLDAEVARLKAERELIQRHAEEYRLISKNAAFAKASKAKKALSDAAEKYGIEVVDILSERRSANVVAARVEAMARVAEETGWGLQRIGLFFNRHHTTVIYALRVAALQSGRTIRRFTPEEAYASLIKSRRVTPKRVQALRDALPITDLSGVISAAKPEQRTGLPDTLNTGDQVPFREAAE